MLTLFIILGFIAAAAATLYLRRANRSPEMLERQAVSGAENFRPAVRTLKRGTSNRTKWEKASARLCKVDNRTNTSVLASSHL